MADEDILAPDHGYKSVHAECLFSLCTSTKKVTSSLHSHVDGVRGRVQHPNDLDTGRGAQSMGVLMCVCVCVCVVWAPSSRSFLAVRAAIIFARGVTPHL